MAVTRTYYITSEGRIIAASPDSSGHYVAYQSHKAALIGPRVPFTDGEGRIFYKADLSEIPSNATIISAKLYITKHDFPGVLVSHRDNTVSVRQITSNWNEGVTWNTQPTVGAEQASFIIYEADPNYTVYEINLTVLVANWVSGAATNYGVRLSSTTGYTDGYVMIASKLDDEIQYRPKLIITYIAPAAVEVETPDGTQDDPTVFTDKVSGFSLTGRIESETNDPLKEFDAQIYDPANNLGWETAVWYNILSNNQISVETDTTGFTSVGGATLSRNISHAFHGTASLSVAVANTDAAGVSISTTAVAGKQYSARVRMRADSGTPTLQMQLRIKDAGGAVLVSKAIPGRVLHSSYALTTGVCLPPTNGVNKNLTYWQIWEIEDVEAPYNASTVEIWITTAGAQTVTWYVDLLELQPNVDLLPLVISGSVSVTVPANVVRYGQVYAWRCKAVNVAGDSGWTPLAYFKCVMSKEGTPTLVAVPAEGVIRLALVPHPAENLAGYRIYRRKTGETDWQKLIDLAASTTVDDEIAANGQSYQYQVAAVAADGYESPASDAVQGSLSVANTFIGDLALEPAPRLDQIVRPFVGRVSPVLGSGYPDVQGQAAARQYRLEGWTQGTDFMRQLETMLALPNKVRYLDPWGETFYFQMMGELQMEKWTAEDLYHWQVEITEVS